MRICDQIIAPDGFECLKKGERYSFLWSDKESKLVTLVQFTTQKKGRRVHIYRLSRDRFEYALQKDAIVIAEQQYALPPWLRHIEGADLDELDLDRTNPKKTNRDRCEDRFGFIYDLLAQLDNILVAKNPFSIINRHAKECKPQQNRERLAEWFFAYVCFSRRLISLYPEYPNIGLFKRSDPKYANAHFGRESLSHGRQYGYASAQFTEEIVAYYKKHAGLRKTIKGLFQDALREVWGCLALMDSQGNHELYHPEGKPYPNTYGKFRYRIIKEFGLRQVQTTLYGAARVRTKIAASQGKYSEDLANLMGEFEVDGYFVKERAKSIFSDEPMPRLCVVRGVCGGSKNVVGIGFSLEGETEEAYRSMLFSAAIPKEKFAQLFGLEGAILDWPCVGLPPHPISDRGPAAVSAMIRNLQIKFPVKEMTETYSGQSKPSVESSHPRDVDVEGPPSYVVSDKNLIQMVQHEICLAALDNHQSYVGDQILGSRVAAEVLPTPYAFWKYMDKLGRNDAIDIKLNEAVRSCLTQITFTLKHDGVWVEDRCFDSDVLKQTNIRQQIAPGQEIEIRGYRLSMCLLYIWVELDRHLIELKQKHPYRDAKTEMLITMEEIKMEAAIMRRLDSAHRTSSDAAGIEAGRLYEQATGAKWSSGTQRKGHPKKNSRSTKVESDLLKPKRRPRKAA